VLVDSINANRVSYLELFYVNDLNFLRPVNVNTNCVMDFDFVSVLIAVVLYCFYLHASFVIKVYLLNHYVKYFISCCIIYCMSAKIIDDSAEKSALVGQNYWNVLRVQFFTYACKFIVAKTNLVRVSENCNPDISVQNLL
jgi:hypothetical protein